MRYTELISNIVEEYLKKVVFDLSQRILKSDNLDSSRYVKVHVLPSCNLREWNLKKMQCLFDVTFDL